MTDTARVILWGRDIGAVTWLPDRAIGVFQYTPEFARSGIEVAPLMMPLNDAPYEFPSLSRETFKGLPGMLADSLPDKFGNALIDAWLSRENRPPDSFTPLERLCYTGTRGMGALEFKPALQETPQAARKVEIDALVALANRVLDDRITLEGKLTGGDDHKVIEDILRVGTSAGGARAKAVLAWNRATGEFRSGQAPAADGFSHWIMKFDGVAGNRDREVADPQGFGRIEYAYHRMARAAGIDMQDCRLHEEGGRAHFMTKRFDRTDDGEKRHMQSLGAMMHYDFNDAGAYAYEQVLQTIRRLSLPMSDLEQQVRRTYFNILARNQDDHVKNIAFLMDRKGAWRLSPAFDVAYSYNPSGAWTSRHQMSLAGKRDGFSIDDLIEFAGLGDIKTARAKTLLADVSAAIRDWRSFADEAGIPKSDIGRIERTHRKELFL
ncbi:type II toxin-antitoxin system HipA family toxin [Eilatimonas milleporae]|uniref:Serine/threonine-protein kinase HipA n=1 Tax=Eilatimonas milleporae TaxID=911205 RepID=A0A3M0C5G7_9PROT|nr:type II toxin-antitoxin system HipA family toxin [Eilatimonas milleporae]RMB04978.1 serine/threonine-protein kinase HipA [Eilatimonas milleporae]